MALKAGLDDVGRWFNGAFLDFYYLGNRVNYETGDLVLDFEDPDPGVLQITLAGKQVEALAEINDRQDVAAQVNDPFNKLR